MYERFVNAHINKTLLTPTLFNNVKHLIHS